MLPIGRRDRGLSQSVQFALIWPVLVLCTLGIIQAGVWIHARNVAIGAVHAGADEARGWTGSADQASATVQELARLGGLTQVQVVVERNSDEVIVTIHAKAPMFLDFGQGSIVASSTAPRERTTDS